MIDIAQEQTRRRLVNDQADVSAHANGPEVRILRLVEAVELHARVGRVHLEIKGRGLDGLLFVTAEFGQAVGEGVGYEEFRCQALGISPSRRLPVGRPTRLTSTFRLAPQ